MGAQLPEKCLRISSGIAERNKRAHSMEDTTAYLSRYAGNISARSPWSTSTYIWPMFIGSQFTLLSTLSSQHAPSPLLTQARFNSLTGQNTENFEF